MIYDIIVGIVALLIWGLVVTAIISRLNPFFQQHVVRVRRTTLDGVPFWAVEWKKRFNPWGEWKSYNHFYDYNQALQSKLRLERVL